MSSLLFAEDQVVIADSKIIHRDEDSQYKIQPKKELEWKYRQKNLGRWHFWT